MINIKKHIWLPLLIFIYFLVMAIIFGPRMIQEGEWLKFSLLCVAELGILILLRFFLLKKEQNKKK